MNPDKNKKQRKFDFVANLINYSINLNRDSNIQIDYSFIKPKDFIKELNEYNEKNPRYLKKGRKKLNEFIAEYDGFTSIKSISKKQVEFTYSDGSKKILDF